MPSAASEAFRKAFANNDNEADRSAALEESDDYKGDGRGEDENNNSNSDLDLIAGDGIGGDNSRKSNQQATTNFAQDVADGKEAVAANDKPVNAVVGRDGDPVAVAATKEQIRKAGATLAPSSKEKRQEEANQPKPNQPEPNTTQEEGASTTSSTSSSSDQSRGFGPVVPQLRSSDDQDKSLLEKIGLSPKAALAGVAVVAVGAVGVVMGAD